MAGPAGRSKLKYVSLVAMIAQTTALVLVLRYSRTMPVDGPRYLSSSAVVISEILKFFTCLLVIFFEHNFHLTGIAATLNAEVFKKGVETAKVAVPAILYVIQNNLLFFALSRLDAATYQVSYQLKILTTALFSVSMLNRSLNGAKWIALLLLIVGVALVQMPSSSGGGEKETSWSSQAAGLLAVLAACVSSGFSGVFFEKILKGTSTSLWIRNLQLAFFSIFGGFLTVAVYDWDPVSQDGLFQGYNWIIWIVVALQAYGGLIIALVVKYADNILKGFAASLSIILSSFLSFFLIGDFKPSLTFALGAATVICSTFLYGYEPKPPSGRQM